MIHWRAGRVASIRAEWPGVREVTVDLETPLPNPAGAPDDAATRPDAPSMTVRALAYTDLVGAPEAGDRVLLNVSALARGLGTGGFGLVVAIPDRLPADPPPAPGHLVKARYTPLQTMVLGVDDQESEHHGAIAGTESIGGTPVIVADLHSALPAIIAGIRAEDEELEVAYVMTDGAALALRFSRAVAGLTEAGWLGTTISVGQAWGGDLEAVTVHTALLAAHEVAAADIIIVSQGPGNLGTGTPFGFSGMAVAGHLDAAALLGGTPVASVRMSVADERPRHFGISHHTLTAVGRAARPGCHVPIPDLATLADEELAGYDTDPRDVSAVVPAQLALLAAHEVSTVDVRGLDASLRASPVRLSTMGRGLAADPASFLAAAAAGRWAARQVLSGPLRGRTRR